MGGREGGCRPGFWRPGAESSGLHFSDCQTRRERSGGAGIPGDPPGNDPRESRIRWTAAGQKKNRLTYVRRFFCTSDTQQRGGPRKGAAQPHESIVPHRAPDVKDQVRNNGPGPIKRTKRGARRAGPQPQGAASRPPRAPEGRQGRGGGRGKPPATAAAARQGARRSREP